MRLTRQIYRDAQPDITILNGDIVDFFGISRFPVPPTRRSEFGEEVKWDKTKIEQLKSWGGGLWVYLEGNHEYRMTTLLYRRAPELANLIEIQELLDLSGLGIHYLEHCQEPALRNDFVSPQVKLGKLYVLHGDTIRMWGNAVNVARSLHLRVKNPMLIGHWHRSDSYLQTDYEGNTSGAWVMGCLARPRPHYDSGRVWGQGCAVIELSNGYFEVSIISYFAKDGKLLALWRGKRYEEKIGGRDWA